MCSIGFLEKSQNKMKHWVKASWTPCLCVRAITSQMSGSYSATKVTSYNMCLAFLPTFCKFLVLSSSVVQLIVFLCFREGHWVISKILSRVTSENKVITLPYLTSPHLTSPHLTLPQGCHWDNFNEIWNSIMKASKIMWIIIASEKSKPIVYEWVQIW